jgi:mannose/fructose/N-acetylgalactosamine-specific phosphotransferase system component IIC
MDLSFFMTCAERAVCVAFVGALLGLDNIAIGQFMLGQPVIGALTLGYILGEPLLGIWAAVTFQLLWLGQIPVGAYLPPSASITAIAAVGLAAPVAAPLASRAVVAAALAIPVGAVAAWMDILIKSRNVGILHRSENDLLDGQPLALGGAVVKGVARFFFKDFFLLLFTVFGGLFLVALVLQRLTPACDRALELVFAISPAVGIAAALKVYWKRRKIIAYGLGAAAAVVITLLMMVLT